MTSPRIMAGIRMRRAEAVTTYGHDRLRAIPGSRDDRSFLYHGDRSEIMMDIPDDIAVRRLAVPDAALPW